jgi:hypothetical protein
VGAEVTTAVERELLQPAGPCHQCDQPADERIIVRLIATNSGPGGTVLGCLPCARRLATWRTAPDWLADDVARLDAARGDGS